MYKNWINAVLGLVVIGVAFMDLSTVTMVWILGISGAVIALSNLWSLLVDPDLDDGVVGHQM
jgi:hypothetical protein